MSNSAHIDNPSFLQLPCNVPSILIDKGGILDLCYQFTLCSSISCSLVFFNLVASAAICMHHNSNLKLLQSKWRWKEAFMPLWNDQDEKVPRLSPGCIAALDWIGWCSVLAERPFWWRREWKVQLGHFDEESESEKFKLDEGWSSPQAENSFPLNNWVCLELTRARLAVKA